MAYKIGDEVKITGCIVSMKVIGYDKEDDSYLLEDEDGFKCWFEEDMIEGVEDGKEG